MSKGGLFSRDQRWPFQCMIGESMMLAIQMFDGDETTRRPPRPCWLTIRGIRIRLNELPSQRYARRGTPGSGRHVLVTVSCCVSTQKFFADDPLIPTTAPGSAWVNHRDPVQWYRVEASQKVPPAVHTFDGPRTTPPPIGMPFVPGARVHRWPSHRNALLAELKSHTLSGLDAATATGIRLMPGTAVIRQRRPFQCSRMSPEIRPPLSV